MNEQELKKCLKEISKIKDNIALERDRLREIVSDLDDIIDSCDSAISDFEHGIMSLSQYL